jgi:hypothetical protein
MMKKTIMLVMAMLAVNSAWAYDAVQYSAAVEYSYTNYSATMGVNFAFSAEGPSNTLMICRWELPVEKPTMEQLDAVMDQALAWKSNHVANAIADIDIMAPQLKDVIRALVKTINLRIPSNKITEAELKAAIKEEALKP